MKSKALKNLVVVVLFLAIASLVVISGTYAKYTTALTGNGTAQVAKWNFEVNDSDTVIENVSLVDTTVYSNVTGNHIAPGTEGGLSVKLDAKGSEVAIDYTVEISNVENKPTNLKFYKDSGFANELTFEGNKATVTGTIALADVNTPIDVPIYWKWDYETADGDATDTAEGIDAKDMTFDVSVTGTQQNPTT